jgi:CheY-like chemotaxis protein
MRPYNQDVDTKKQGILIVDDEEHVRSFCRAILIDAGYTNVQVAADGMTALSLLASSEDTISVIVLDIRMPGMDGFGVIKHLTNVHVYPVGIVVLTGYGGDQSRAEFFSMGNETVLTTQFLSKPIKGEELITEVEHTLHCVHKKRVMSRDAHNEAQAHQIAIMEETLRRVETDLKALLSKHRSFITELGMDVIRSVLIAVAFLAMLYFGVGDFLQRIIHK